MCSAISRLRVRVRVRVRARARVRVRVRVRVRDRVRVRVRVRDRVGVLGHLAPGGPLAPRDEGHPGIWVGRDQVVRVRVSQVALTLSRSLSTLPLTWVG